MPNLVGARICSSFWPSIPCSLFHAIVPLYRMLFLLMLVSGLRRMISHLFYFPPCFANTFSKMSTLLFREGRKGVGGGGTRQECMRASLLQDK